MKNKINDSELRAALQRWVDHCLPLISGDLENLVRQVGLPTWHKDDIGNFIKLPYLIFYDEKKLRKIIYENKEWSNLQGIWPSHVSFAKHIGKLIGSPYGQRSSFSVEDLCRFLLPPPKTDGKNIFLDTEYNPVSAVKDLLNAVNDENITTITVWPICGVGVQEEIVLDNQTSFRKLTDQEKLNCLGFDIIRPFGNPGLVEGAHANWHGLVRSETVTKVFVPQDTVPADFMERIFSKETTLEDFLSIVPLLGNHFAHHAGGYSSAPSFETNGILSRGTAGYTSESSHRFMFFDSSNTLTSEKVTLLKELWTLTKSARTNKAQKRVVNAMKRLYYADTRQKSEDQLIDCMIAAESLYLDSDKNELSYRLALNAAMWDENRSMKKEDVYILFKKAYDLRSKIVHGSSADHEKVIDVVSKVKTILQSGVVKAFQGLSNESYPPKWTEKLLE
ncbi:MAG: hypothetical protein HY940_02210 [Gammaproteobacteria bacterium]|nr:hypothetical protein [Gammaproteobacteria bacterium]